MLQTIPSAQADRLAFIIEGLCLAVARRGARHVNGWGGPRLAGPFIILVWSRLRRIAARFAACAAAPSALPSRPQAVPDAGIAAAAKPSGKRPASASHPLPRRKAWLLRLMPETASGAAQLRHFLADPEVAALLAEAPRLHRILRPLCHALGIRPAPAPPAPAPPPPPAPPISPQAPKPAPASPSLNKTTQSSARPAGRMAAAEPSPTVA